MLGHVLGLDHHDDRVHRRNKHAPAIVVVLPVLAEVPLSAWGVSYRVVSTEPVLEDSSSVKKISDDEIFKSRGRIASYDHRANSSKLISPSPSKS